MDFPFDIMVNAISPRRRRNPSRKKAQAKYHGVRHTCIAPRTPKGGVGALRCPAGVVAAGATKTILIMTVLIRLDHFNYDHLNYDYLK